MELQKESRSGALILTPQLSQIEATNAAFVFGQLSHEIDSASENKIILNLDHLSFIDSAGLKTLLNLQQAVRGKRGKELFLTNIHPPVSMIFEMVELNRIFSISRDTEEALSMPPQA